MENDIAIFLDLDNVVIGAQEVNLAFDINLVLEKVCKVTDGRLVLRRAYGDWRQRANLTKDLATAGFELQSTVRLGNNSKNLADMQLTVDAMSTLVDHQNFKTYVLITGDRDFAPLVQALRKRGKRVVGVGISHTTSQNLARLCDEYIYYDGLTETSRELLDDQLEELLQRALDQLLQEEDLVPASLLKQRMQSLSKGAFSRSQQGKRSFRKLLSDYPNLVEFRQEGTTLYISRPGTKSMEPSIIEPEPHLLAEEEIQSLISRSLDELTQVNDHIRASLLKQRMQDLSHNAFDETHQGDKSFRKFLERYPTLVAVDQEGSTLYVSKPISSGRVDLASKQRPLSTSEVEGLLRTALDELLVDQDRVRASLLKQRMQELSHGAFNETQQGAPSFRRFLETYPELVQIQEKGTTLLVRRSTVAVDPSELHLRYRSGLKRAGLRVVPSPIRLLVLKDLITFLQSQNETTWRKLVNELAVHYHHSGNDEVSKSFINDVLRIARRAGVIDVQNGIELAIAPVFLKISGDRLFQNAVMMCDATFLREIQSLGSALNLDEISIALYESKSQSRYLKVILNRLPKNGSAGR